MAQINILVDQHFIGLIIILILFHVDMSRCSSPQLYTALERIMRMTLVLSKNVHSAAVLLEKSQLIKYERAPGRFFSTELGRIASHYYVTHNSMMVYNQHLRTMMSMLELFRVFALSNEFKLLPARVSALWVGMQLIIFLLRFIKKRSSNWLSCWNVCQFPSRKVLKNLRQKSMYCCKPIFRSSNSQSAGW